MFRFLMIALLMFITANMSAEDKPLVKETSLIEMHDEAMKYRSERGLPNQMLDEKCCRVAQRWAEYMASRRAFHHGGGEQIIAYGYPTIRSAFLGWMGSSGHRAWILSNTKRAGWGFAKASDGTCYYAGCFSDHDVTVPENVTNTNYSDGSGSRRRFFRRR